RSWGSRPGFMLASAPRTENRVIRQAHPILDQTKASLKEMRFSLDDTCRAADYTVIGRKWYYAPSPDQ
ncbi:MAG TPA: hypothetical protein VFF31_13040, partial [Blastocatellia bacterium]|nr:hypothetical protein [Blastocatellia bacterium]